jgi:type II secretion system protein G
MRDNSKGFTLIELLVVIAIIGMLSSVALTSTRAARVKAQRAKAQSELRQLYDLLQAYYIETNDWPSVSDNMDNLTEWNGAWNTSGTVVANDPWGRAYIFDGPPDEECSAGDSSLCSRGADGVDQSRGHADMKAGGDDVCIFFPPEC